MTAICIAAVLAVLAVIAVHRWFPRGRIGATPQRVLVGDQLVTADGLLGSVVRIDGPSALVQLEGTRQVTWVRSRTLVRTAPPHPDSKDPPPEPEPIPSALPPPPTGLVTDHGRLYRLGQWTARSRRRVALAWVIVLAVSVPLAATVSHALQPGGFVVEGGAAIRVANELHDHFGRPRSTIVILLPGDSRDPGTRARLTRVRVAITHVAHVSSVSKPDPTSTHRYVAIEIGFNVLDQGAIPSVNEVRLTVGKVGGYNKLQVQIAGTAATATDTNDQARSDLAQAEAWGIPAALIVLLLVFGTLPAAIVPIVVGATATLLSLALLHLIGMATDLSTFVMNIASMLGLGLGIDYSLLGVNRFREEQRAGRDVDQALATTVASSGRAALISGLAVMCGFGALAVMPLGVMRSIAIAGVVVVGATVVTSLTLLPALLGLLGPRIERLALFRRRERDPATSVWYRAAKGVMRTPLLSILVGCALLAPLVVAFAHSHFELPHEEVLPRSSPSRIAEQALELRLKQTIHAPIDVIVHSRDDAVITALEQRISALPHVQEVDQVAVAHDGSAGVALEVLGDDSARVGGAKARALVGEIAAMGTPTARIEVGGVPEGEREFLTALARDLPIVAGLVILSTVLILGIGFRSFTLPLKAVVLDSLSILAAFGAVTMVFQDGHGIGLLGTTALGYSDATLPVILLCILFGLSMDYEVFMLAKITELHQAGHSEEEATALGVASTAPLVTGAAAILVVIGLSFALTKLVLVQEIGFGMAAALTLDATVVRLLLLPATMGWLGAANWWMPESVLRRVPRTDWAH